MYSLFKLDTTYPSKIEKVDIEYTGKGGNTYTKTEYIVHFQDAATTSMSSFLIAWKKMRDAYDNEEITKNNTKTGKQTGLLVLMMAINQIYTIKRRIINII